MWSVTGRSEGIKHERENIFQEKKHINMMISSICHIMSQQNIRRWRYQTGLHSFRLSQHLQGMRTLSVRRQDEQKHS